MKIDTVILEQVNESSIDSIHTCALRNLQGDYTKNLNAANIWRLKTNPLSLFELEHGKVGT